MPLNYLYVGGLAVVTPSGDDGEMQTEPNLAKQTPENVAAWMEDAGERLVSPWESSPFAAERRAARDGKPLLVIVGRERELCAAFRDAGLAETLQRVVLLRVDGASKLYPAPAAPGALLYDPLERREIASWSGSKKAEDVKGLVEKALAGWAASAEQRRAGYESSHPYVCPFCGWRSAESESCCGLPMVKPEPPVWEKSFAEAKERAARDGRVLVYVVLRDAKEFVRYQDLFAEPRLAALAGQVVFCAEEMAEAGDRAKELGGRTGLYVLASPDGKAEPGLQARAEGAPGAEAARRAILPVVRRALTIFKKR